MINYILSLENEGVSMEEMERIAEMSIADLEEDYNNQYNNNMATNKMALMETIIWQLSRNKPQLEGLGEILEGIEPLQYDIALEDIRLIEQQYYNYFIDTIPIKYFNDIIALRTYMNDFIDYLNKNQEIADYTAENIDYNIIQTDTKNIG